MLKILSLETTFLVKSSVDVLLIALIRNHRRKYNYEVKCDEVMLVEIIIFASKISETFMSAHGTTLIQLQSC
jgi:hypothetical protein